MKPESKLMNRTHRIAFLAWVTCLVPLVAAAETKKAEDPFAGAFFPPDLVLLAGDQIALTAEQRVALHEQMDKMQRRSEELRAKMEGQVAALATLAKQERVDEAAILGQLDKVLDVEREVKHLHVGLMVSIKNRLSSEQQAKLREIAKEGGARLAEDTRKRLTDKVARVEQIAQSWAANGRDPSALRKLMEERVKPLLETGKPLEAEVELDRLLEQFKQDKK